MRRLADTAFPVGADAGSTGFRVAARRSAIVDAAHGSSGSRDTGERNESWREFELDWQLGDVAGRLRLKIGADYGSHATGKKRIN